MTPEQAINILDNVSAQIPLKRDDQSQVILAIQVLRKAITPIDKPIVDTEKALA